MKNLSILNKILFLLNSILATLLLLSLSLPFISPKLFPSIGVIGLFYPFLIAVNLAFIGYWLIQFKKQFLLSTLILGACWYFSPPIYKFSKEKEKAKNGLSVMSYNVRMFNHWKWMQDQNISAKIGDFVRNQNPDIVLFQEYYKNDSLKISYPYNYIKTKKVNDKVGLAIFSKYPILKKGSFDFKNTSNNIIYIDVLKDEDTIRVYNLHLQSLQLNPSKVNFGEENSEKLFSRLKNGFLKQVDQGEAFLAHEQQWEGKKIIAGDFNNTSYSWLYNQIAKNKKDAFIEAGSGFGKTYVYPFPLRIDFVLTDLNAEVLAFQDFTVNYSDHYPIQAQIVW